LDPELKDASSVVIVLRNGMEVLGKRLTKAVSDSVSYMWAVTHCRQRT